jgi:hypothetical protein
MGVFRDEISRSAAYRGQEELGAINTIHTGPATEHLPIFTNKNATWPKVFYVAVYVASIGSDISTVNFQLFSELYVRQAVMRFSVLNSLQVTFSVPGNALIGVNLFKRPNALVGDRLLLQIVSALHAPPFLLERTVDYSVDVLAYN